MNGKPPGTTKPTVTFDACDVVRVPFPFTDRTATKRRPALVLSAAGAFNTLAGHSVMAMITTQGHTPWPLDYSIQDLQSAGLPAPSVVRFKLFTLDHRRIQGTLGHLAKTDAQNIADHLNQLFPTKPQPI